MHCSKQIRQIRQMVIPIGKTLIFTDYPVIRHGRAGKITIYR